MQKMQFQSKVWEDYPGEGNDNKYCEDISEPEFSSHLERNLIYKVLLLGVMTDEKVSCPASEAQGCRPSCVQLFCDPVECSPPGSSTYGTSQTRILDELPFSSSGDLPDPGIEPTSPTFPGFFTLIGPGWTPDPNQANWVLCPGNPTLGPKGIDFKWQPSVLQCGGHRTFLGSHCLLNYIRSPGAALQTPQNVSSIVSSFIPGANSDFQQLKLLWDLSSGLLVWKALPGSRTKATVISGKFKPYQSPANPPEHLSIPCLINSKLTIVLSSVNTSEIKTGLLMDGDDEMCIPPRATQSDLMRMLPGLWMFYSALMSFPIGKKKVRVAKQFEEIKENGPLL
ncbi:hypothetical protein MG293_000270 [Ovis ammon polii]|uniref:Uncharacterized protein n=1 Tax=Ovis ammon polii TaxID=230172 RepID=A0AAD4UQ95_OVIAM|nr:hypothetical protein MG293_000270 [Ovis ammon polii]